MSTQGPLNIPPGYGYTPGPSAFPNHIGPIFQKTVTPPSGPVEHSGQPILVGLTEMTAANKKKGES